MDFEQAYSHYKDGTATAEEVAYVEGEIEKVRTLTGLIDKQDEAKCNIVQADDATVKKAKKQFTLRSIIRTAVVSVVVLVFVAGVVCAGVFGTAVSSAKGSLRYTIDEAEAMAKQYCASQSSLTVAELITTEKERDLKIEPALNHSYYYYSFEFQRGEVGEFDVYVNAKTGAVSFVDYDKD